MAKLGAEIRHYFAISGVLNFGIAVPQAILTPILLSKGLDFQKILIVQLVYMAVVSVLELPSGIMADRYSRKLMYLSGCAFVAIGYSVVLFEHGLVWMTVAWVLYATGQAAMSSTMDVHFLAQVRSDDELLKKYYSMERSIPLVTVILATVTSTGLYGLLGSRVYGISLVMFAASLVWGLWVLPSRSHGNQVEASAPTMNSIIKQITIVYHDRDLARLALVFCVAQLALMPFFQLWQMIFVGLNVPVVFFGAFFIYSQLVNIACNALIPRLKESRSRWTVLLLVLVALGVLVYFLSGTAAIICIVVSPAALFFVMGQIELGLQKRIPEEVLSGSMSAIGALNSAVSIVAILACIVAVNYMAPDALFAVLLVCACLGMIALVMRSGGRQVIE